MRFALLTLLVAILLVTIQAGSFIVLGPIRILRASGAPTLRTMDFTVSDPTKAYLLRIDNEGVTSGRIILNEAEVVRSGDFKNGKVITRQVRLRSNNRLTVELQGEPGEALGLQITGSDDTPPIITGVVSPKPNAAGWNSSDATVTFSCEDATSGIASCSPPAFITTESAGQVAVGTAVDNAKNMATVSVAVKLDRTPPVLGLTSRASQSTVFTSPVAVTGMASDALSGLANVTCNGVPAALEGSNFNCGVTLTPGANSIEVVATDLAGNIGTSGLSLNYARVPQITITSPANLAYLNIGPTTVTGTVGDPQAVVTINSVQAAVVNGNFSAAIPLAEGPNLITASAISQAGAVGTASIRVTLDTTPPHITVISPPNQFVTSDSTISVTGSVNDIVVGTVNSDQAQVRRGSV